MKIGIAECRSSISEALRRALALRPGHEIIWIAHSGAEALERCATARPDVLLMELTVPVMGGIEATRRIMSTAPCAILIVARGAPSQASLIFEAMGHGALDAVDMFVVNRNSIAGVTDFRKRIDAVAALVEAGRFVTGADSPLHPAPTAKAPLIAIGASAGGPTAVASILENLPADFPAALIIVQHIDARLARSMAEWLRKRSRLPVRLAEENDVPEAGTVLLAYPTGHLKLKGPDRLGYTIDPRAGYLPCIDVFFHSVSALWPGGAAGVLLTGIGRDGAAGLKAMRDRGHYTIAQNRATSVVYGMPGAAKALGAAVDVLPLERIAERLMEFSVASADRATATMAAVSSSFDETSTFPPNGGIKTQQEAAAFVESPELVHGLSLDKEAHDAVGNFDEANRAR